MAQKPRANALVREIIERSDIVPVAQALGLTVDPRDSRPRKALCPFHDDRTPSLNLYQRAGDRDNFHCFACGANGDIVNLVRRRLGDLPFWDAIRWLAPFAGTSLAAGGREVVPDRRRGAVLFAERLRGSPEGDELAGFAERRGFSPEFLRDAGAGVYDLAALRREAASDPVLEESLKNAGIMHPEPASGQAGGERSWLRGFYRGKRIVFPLGSAKAPAGFAARALGDEDPRYLYSFDFPRRDTLYGAERIESWLRASGQRGAEAYIYIVEGLFDQLRLESLGIAAVALLGSRASAGQIEGLRRLAEQAGDSDRPLTFRLFLDPDASGRAGAYDLLLALMRLLDGGAVFGIEVIVPPPLDDKADPDAYLRGQAPADAAAMLDDAAYTPFEFMLGIRAGQTVPLRDPASLSAIQRAAIARHIAQSLGPVAWDRILAPLRVSKELGAFTALVRSYGEGTEAPSKPATDFPQPAAGDPRAVLITALTIGRSSTQRREYPLEDEAWERLAVAASPLFHLHKERLHEGHRPMAPLLARHLPKGGGRYRLKAGPVAADALLQQYALIELLRDRGGAPGFSDGIPAVRYDRSAGGKGMYRTGARGGEESEALSFAYQVDMGIVNGLAPPAREGIFRPYFECWRAFIDHLDAKLRRYRHEDLQILRLDITGFYEHVRRDVIGDALQVPLERALAKFGQAEGGARGFAPLLRPDAGDEPAERANIFTEFLLDHAFHNDHADPETGKAAKLSGLPQGPDLSAYLANISLFDLDDMMRAEVERIDELFVKADAGELTGAGGSGEGARNEADAMKRDGGCSAAYARYVDDIIIICPNADVAGQLRRKIETHLQIRGLSLNRKNPTPPLMTREEAREWLTDSRMGFGFSGPLADMPVTEAMDPLADAGDIDRRTALGLLFDPELDDLRYPHRIAARIERAFHATEVRFGDRANAYRRLWLIAAGEKDATPADIAREFRTEARGSDVRARTVEAPLDVALAALEAIERALRAPIPEALDEEARDCWADRKRRLSEAVLGDLFEPMASAFLGSDASQFLARYDVRCQIAIIACLALALRSPPPMDSAKRPFAALHRYLAASEGDPLPDSLQLSLFRYDGELRPKLPELVVPSARQAKRGFDALETALVELQRFGENPGGDVEDLSPPTAPDPAAAGIERMVADILSIWRPRESEGAPSVDPVEIDAAATLVNVTYRRFALIAQNRPRLIRLIADQDGAVALPSPPGLEASGVMLWCKSGALIFAAADAQAVCPAGVEWHIEPGDNQGFLTRWRASLATGVRPLFDLDTVWEAGDIAAIYRAGHRPFRQLLDAAGGAHVPVPTAFSFFAPIGQGDEVDVEATCLICWTAPREAVDGHAFVRNGSALEARSVHSLGADHWRYGWAVRDLCRRPEGPAEDVLSLENHSDTNLDRVGHRRDAILARVLPRLSGADRWGPGIASPEDGIPSRIARALRLLTAFGETERPEAQASYLVAATAEGLFMSERLGTVGDPSHSGRPAAIAVRAARRISRALPAAGAIWSAGSPPRQAAGRRSAAAWFAAAGRVDVHLADLDEGAAVPLRALRLGLTLLGATAELRALAFELASALPAQSLERLQGLPIDLSFAMPYLGGEVALVDEPDTCADGDPAVQVRQLLRTFGQIVEGRRTAAAAARDMITPLGWLILVATLLQVTPPAENSSTEERPVLWRMTPENFDRAGEAVAALLPFVAASAPDDAEDGHWPWTIFTPLAAAMPEALRDDLLALSAAASIRIATERSAISPRTGETVEGRPVLRLADGSSHRLSEWQIDVAYVAGERRLSTEGADVDGRIHYRYSVAWNNDRVVGLHLVSQSLAEMAFAMDGAAANIPVPAAPRARIAAGSGDVPAMPAIDTVDGDEPGSVEAAELRAGAGGGTGGGERTPPDVATPEQGQPEGPSRPGAARSDRDTIGLIRERQEGAWSGRAKKGHDRQRLAIVQWDVADTYHAPGTGDGKNEGLRTLDGGKPEKEAVRNGGHFQSIAEGRRRAILSEVLRACALFKVDGLVLPEYSVRPETVNWLTRQLQARNLPLTIWAGTFRVPDGASVSTRIPSSGVSPYFVPLAPGSDGVTDWSAHSALLTCIVASSSEGRMRVSSRIRRKRYSSPAAGELIRPAVRELWAPMLADTKDAFELGTYTIELVCSEMFLHASSANFIGILEENRKLASRYGLAWPPSESASELDDDMHVFARWTSYRGIVEPPSLARGKALQRTVVILPAMSSRSADYHIFGQNQYLAAGLVTAFCNAVEPVGGVGGSAFIGLDGWKDGTEAATPYGSLAPGIFQLGDKHSGALGKKEAAMVIADIDPIRTTDLKPRPHYQGRSLELIAHLPLLFATEPDPSPSARGTRKRLARQRIVGGEALEFPQAARTVLEVLESEELTWRHERALADPDPKIEASRQIIVQKTAAALDMLAHFADDPDWLQRRAKAFRDKRWHFSPPMFLPALTDWLYIEDGWTDMAVDLQGRHPLEVDDNVLDVPRDCGASHFEA